MRAIASPISGAIEMTRMFRATRTASVGAIVSVSTSSLSCEAAMRAPARLKRDYALYADFLRQLDSRVAEVKKSDWGYAPTSPLVRFKSIAEMVRAGTPAPLKRALGSLRRPRSEANAARTKRPEFLAAVQSRPNGIFDRKSLDEIARRGCGKTHFHMLATAMLYVDGIWREPATAL